MTDPHGGQAEQGVSPGAAIPHQAAAPAVETAGTTPSPWQNPAAPSLGAPAEQTAQLHAVPAAAQFQTGSAPVPAPGADAPVSAPGYDTYAMAAASAAPAPKKRGTGTIVLSVVTGVLALATVALGVLYFLETQARADTDAQLLQKTAALTAEQTKAKDLDSQLKVSKEEVAKLNQDLTGAKAKTDEVTKARDAVVACFQAIEAFDAKQNADNAKQVIIKCDEAEKYL